MNQKERGIEELGEGGRWGEEGWWDEEVHSKTQGINVLMRPLPRKKKKKKENDKEYDALSTRDERSSSTVLVKFSNQFLTTSKQILLTLIFAPALTSNTDKNQSKTGRTTPLHTV